MAMDSIMFLECERALIQYTWTPTETDKMTT